MFIWLSISTSISSHVVYCVVLITTCLQAQSWTISTHSMWAPSRSWLLPASRLPIPGSYLLHRSRSLFPINEFLSIFGVDFIELSSISSLGEYLSLREAVLAVFQSLRRMRGRGLQL